MYIVAHEGGGALISFVETRLRKHVILGKETTHLSTSSGQSKFKQ
jgi:hypothetical protein